MDKYQTELSKSSELKNRDEIRGLISTTSKMVLGSTKVLTKVSELLDNDGTVTVEDAKAVGILLSVVLHNVSETASQLGIDLSDVASYDLKKTLSRTEQTN